MNSSPDGGKGGGSTSVSSSLGTSTETRHYHFTYSGDAAKKVDRKTVELTVEADPNTGKDRIENRADEQELALIQEQVAQSSLKK
jgi:hypothetical protein